MPALYLSYFYDRYGTLFQYKATFNGRINRSVTASVIVIDLGLIGLVLLIKDMVTKKDIDVSIKL